MSQARGGTNGSDGPHADSGALQVKAYQTFWFALTRSDWSSLVLVPADPEGSAEEVARALADVGKRLSDGPVTAVTASALEYGTAVALADLPRFVEGRRALPPSQWPTIDVDSRVVEQRPADDGAPQPEPGAEGRQDLVVSSRARLIISIPPVVSVPWGLATTKSADLTVLCVEMGRTRLANARRTVELIGRERIAGCFLVR